MTPPGRQQIYCCSNSKMDLSITTAVGCDQGYALGGGGASLSTNFTKVGHAAGTLALIRKFDQIYTCNSFILLFMVGHIQLSFL